MKTKFSTKNFAAFAALALLLFGLMIQTVFSQSATPFSINNSPLPAPTGFVNDYAGVIDAGTKQKLETQLKAFKQRTNPSIEIAVAVVNTTGDRDIFDYSLAVARGWGIGSKNTDNPSALLFIAVQDRKYFTQVSRDLEDELPDGAVGSLQRQYLVPEFKQGDYSKGISDTIDAYVRRIEAKQRGEAVPGETAQKNDPDAADRTFNATSSPICRGICIIAVILFLIAIFSGGGRGGRGGRRGGGGGFGNALLWAILSGAASGGGGGGSSGGWGGGSSGGSSGGFGGFGGGGDFGGGGAGGSW